MCINHSAMSPPATGIDVMLRIALILVLSKYCSFSHQTVAAIVGPPTATLALQWLRRSGRRSSSNVTSTPGMWSNLPDNYLYVNHQIWRQSKLISKHNFITKYLHG